MQLTCERKLCKQKTQVIDTFRKSEENIGDSV